VGKGLGEEKGSERMSFLNDLMHRDPDFARRYGSHAREIVFTRVRDTSLAILRFMDEI